MTFDGVEELHKVAREYAALKDRQKEKGPLEEPQVQYSPKQAVEMSIEPRSC